MKAIHISRFGGPEVLELAEFPVPEISADEVLIRVHAAGVNRPDVFQRRGNYAAPAGVVADIPGLEVAGEVVALGTAVSDWQLGDRVCALVAGGGYSTFVQASSGCCLPIPENISYAEAAILPETLFTVWDNVFRRGALKAGEKILIHGGAGGIGSTAIQLAVLAGATPYVTVSTAEKAAYCQALGAYATLNYKTEDFASVWADVGFDVILDAVGGDYFPKNMQVIAPDGRLVYINAMEGAKVTLNLFQLMQKRVQLTGSTLRARPNSFKAELAKAIYDSVWPWVTAKKFKPQLAITFPLEDAAEAHKLMESSDLLGKIALVI